MQIEPIYASFYPNSCMYCHAFGKDADLITCDKCFMSSYCKGKHQEDYQRYHKTICIAIQEAYQDDKLLYFVRKVRDLSLDEWNSLKYFVMQLVLRQMHRKMYAYEAEMFMFPKACVVCYRQEGELIACPNCPNVSFCIEHNFWNGSPLHTEEICASMKFCYELEIRFDWQNAFLNNISGIEFLSNENSIQQMTDIFKVCVNPENVIDLPIEAYQAYFSLAITCPMSVFYGLQKLEYSPSGGEIVIHIVDTTFSFIKFNWGWEILFHLIPSITSIYIIIINSNLSYNIDPPLCKKCKPSKKIVFKFINIPYSIYVEIAEIFQKPDIIVQYDLIMHKPPCKPLKGCYDVLDCRSHGFLNTMRIILKLKCPFISLRNEQLSMEQGKMYLNTYFAILGKSMELVYQGKNPFATTKPMRNAETCGVFYTNSYLLAYKNISP